MGTWDALVRVTSSTHGNDRNIPHYLLIARDQGLLLRCLMPLEETVMYLYQVVHLEWSFATMPYTIAVSYYIILVY